MKKLILLSFTFLFSLLFLNANAQQADAEVSNFVSPVNSDVKVDFCPGVLPININIYNNDLVDITQVVLDWSVNSVAQPQITWSGTLAAGDITPVELNPSFTFTAGDTFNIQVSINSVNMLPDTTTSNNFTSVTFYAYEVFMPFFYWDGCALNCLNKSDYISIQWYKDGSPDPNAPDSGVYSPSQSGNYTMIGLTPDSCDAVADTSIFVTPITHGITPLSLTTFCAGDSVGLVFSASVQVFFTWNTTSSADTIYASTDGWYSVNGTTANSCPVHDSIHVTVHPLPVISISDLNDTLISTYSGYQQWYIDGNQIGGAHDSIYIPTQSGLYFCTATDVYGCMGTSNTINWIMPGIITPVENSEVMLFPNPVKDYLNIRFESPGEKFLLSISDVTGRLVLEKEIYGDDRISIAGLTQGAYHCVLSGNGKTYARKLIKN